jgi:signal transduction histidine kinase
MERHTDKEIKRISKHSADNEKESALKALMKTLESVNDRLRESESLKTHFLSNIRNEINNPLSSIMGLSRQIIDGPNLNFDAIQKCAIAIYSEAFDLDFQLRNIFVAAEIEAGEHALSLSNVDVHALLQNTVQSFQHKSAQKNIEVNCSSRFSNDYPEKRLFKTDPEKLKLVISNLLSNAIEFSHEKGKIEVTSEQKERTLVLSVKDYGVGFNMKDEKVIFERFRQLDTGVMRKHRGHGLGLSITKDIVELLNGSISVVSDQGKETIFAVLIPTMEDSEGTDSFSDDGNVFIF